MRETRIIMGMPVTVEVVGNSIHIEKVFAYFTYVDEKFSTYKKTSEISAIREGRLKPPDYSPDMKEIFKLSEETKKETDGFFDIVNREGKYDPSGIVKGWAIYNTSKILRRHGVEDFFIDAGGDVQTSGHTSQGEDWKVGIANPFDGNYAGSGTIGDDIIGADAGRGEKKSQVVKVIHVSGEGVATSGTAVRGQHIYNPHKRYDTIGIGEDGIYDIVSLTVIGPNIYEADRFATAAFAMGKKGIAFIEGHKGRTGRLEGYMIDANGIATMTSGFEKYTRP